MPRKRKAPSPIKDKSAKSRKEDDKFSLLGLPTEILFKIYIHLDYATRRALRCNRKLAEIEKQTKYRCQRLDIIDVEHGVRIKFDGDEVMIPHSEVEKELKLMRENTSLHTVIYKKEHHSIDRKILNEILLIKAERIAIKDNLFNDSDLESLVKNATYSGVLSTVTEDGIMRLYEKMRDHPLEDKIVAIIRNDVNELWSLLEKFGTFNRETLQFTATNPNLMSSSQTRDDSLWITLVEGNMGISFAGVNPNWEGRRSIQLVNLQ